MARCLDFHAAYRCRHAGACCSQDWHIPLESHVLQLVGAPGMPEMAEGLAPGAALPRHGSGACVFFDADGGRLCRIHAAAGPDALPSACRHFPRVVLQDDRGTFISLSHFCPTAARMLLDGGAEGPHCENEDIVVDAPAPLNIPNLDGFDARGALPPLLRPGVLTDLEGYTAWERAAIQTFARADLSAAQALEVLAAATRRIREWRPGTSPLSQAVSEAYGATAMSEPAKPFGSPDRRIPREAGSRELVQPYDGAVKRYLAARLFASPLAYEAQGLLTNVGWLRTCLETLEREMARGAEAGDERFVEGVRRADLKLVHQTDTRAYARRAARTIEGARP